MFKKGDTCSINHYRSVSILSVFSNLFEKQFLNRTLFFKKHNQLSENQFGFTKGKSTVDDMVVEGLECRQSTIGAFKDLSKAFDCIDRGILPDRLDPMAF